MKTNPNKFKQLRGYIEKAETIAVFAHEYPDGDALGSALSLFFVLKQMGKVPFLVLSKADNEYWSFLDFAKDLDDIISKDLGDNVDLGIILDSSNLRRLGEIEHLVGHVDRVVNIDHHGDNDQFGDLNITREASSTGEILSEIFLDWDVCFSREIACSLMLSIITDTGRYMYSNTSARVMELSGFLMSKLAPDDYGWITRNLFEEVPMDVVRMKTEAISNMMELSNGIVFSWLELECKGSDEVLESIRIIKGITAVILARISDGRLKLSFRSKDTTFSVREMARLFGGGGHPQASGASIALVNYDVQRREIVSKLTSYLESR
jgi:bifunctional oligoribonuclease and PAP phosphatase NrnA